ncbi:MAG TPA: helical backbone metal receptor, partial [Gemmatimonadaceae bacterium]
MSPAVRLAIRLCLVGLVLGAVLALGLRERSAAPVPFDLSASPAPSAPPTRIVSLVPNVTEMIFAIGAGDRLVGVSSFDEYPPEVKRIARVGALLDPDLERIFALRPDLVVVYASQRDLEKQLRGAGIDTFSYRHGGVSDITAVMRELGKRLGIDARADAAATKIEADLDRIRARVGGRGRPRVLLVFGREKGALRGIYASGGYGFLHDLVAIGGGENVFADVKRESVQASTEMILARAPDVIVEIHGGEVLSPEAAAREARVWSALSSLPAVRNHRVYVLSGQDLVSPGPRIVQAAARIARAIHPERP